jgi:predicted nucleic-acid-binding protein
MKIVADTNILVRAIMDDDRRQSAAARAALEAAELVAVSTPVLCELVWVLSRGYKVADAEISAAIIRLLDSASVECNRAAAEAGLAMLEAGGDFADGVIIAEGQMLGGETFVSFDRKALKLAKSLGCEASPP